MIQLAAETIGTIEMNNRFADFQKHFRKQNKKY